MNISKNFLSKKDFKKLKDVMMGYNFPWYFNDFVNYKDRKKNEFQFTFTFIKTGGECNCSEKIMLLLKPIFNKIKCKKINRVKANLLLKDFKIKEHSMHIDQKIGTTGILYINDNNGYTKFENGKKIKSEENKYVEFNSLLKHTGTTCTNENRRVVLNINYV